MRKTIMLCACGFAIMGAVAIGVYTLWCKILDSFFVLVGALLKF